MDAGPDSPQQPPTECPARLPDNLERKQQDAAPDFRTVDGLIQWCRQAPPGTQLNARAVADLLKQAVSGADEENPTDPPVVFDLSEMLTWREKIWLVPSQTRLGMEELSEALGRPKSFVYKLTAKGDIPFRKQHGVNVFLAGEIRSWIESEEKVKHSLPMQSTAFARTLDVLRRAS